MAKCCVACVDLYYLNALFLAVMEVLLGLVSCSLHGITLYEFMMHYKMETPTFAELGMAWSAIRVVCGLLLARWAMVRTKCNFTMTTIVHAINKLISIALITLIIQKLLMEDTECTPCQDPRDDLCNPLCRFGYKVWLGVLVGLACAQIVICLISYLMCYKYYKNIPDSVSSVSQSVVPKEDNPPSTTLTQRISSSKKPKRFGRSHKLTNPNVSSISV